jgi:hypothetical protein
LCVMAGKADLSAAGTAKSSVCNMSCNCLLLDSCMNGNAQELTVANEGVMLHPGSAEESCAMPSLSDANFPNRKSTVGLPHTTSVAVIGRAEDGDNILVMAPVIALHDQLMRSRHQSQTVCMVELLRYVLTKGVPCASWRYAPTTSVIRI